MFPVQPDAELAELVRHLAQEVEGEVAARRHELLDAEVLDLAFVRDPERLLDLDLDRQAVHVEPCLIAQVEPLHPPPSDDRVLDRLVQRVSQVDRGGRVRRSVDEVEIFAGLAELPRLLVRLRAPPKLADPLLEVQRVVVLRRHAGTLQLVDVVPGAHLQPGPGAAVGSPGFQSRAGEGERA